MFGTVEGYGEMFQPGNIQRRDGSLSSTNQIGNPVAYKLVRVAGDGRLIPATDEEMLEVKDLLANNESDMPILPDTRQTEGCIPDEGSPSQYLQLENVEGLFESETAEAYTENMNSRLKSEEELMFGSQLLFALPDTKLPISNELHGNEEQVQSKVLLQEPICLLSNGCDMIRSTDASPYLNAISSPKEPALSSTASKPEFYRVAGEICLDNLPIKALQETFRATFGRETTCKDKQWLKRRITMGLNSCVVPTPSLEIKNNTLMGGGQDKYNDTTDAFSKDTVDEERTTNRKDTPSSSDCIKGHSNDFGHSPVEIFVDHYSGYEDFEGEHRSAKRVRKPTRRYIEEMSVTDEKQQHDESMISSKDQRSIQAVSSGGRVVVTRMVSLAGSRIQVPYVAHVRRSRPRENIMALGEFHSKSWEVAATPIESNLNRSTSQLNNDTKGVSKFKSASGLIQKDSDKNHVKPKFAVVDQDMMEVEHVNSAGDSSDDNSNNNRVGVPLTENAIRRKHHRAWTLSEVQKLVEGVSKYGVGKWSEIKRLSFSSYSYRTSVDLKDKWRNLRKACFAQTCSNRMRMGSLKKHGSMAIPSDILLQVRELVQKQSLVSPVSKPRTVKESRNGFL